MGNSSSVLPLSKHLGHDDPTKVNNSEAQLISMRHMYFKVIAVLPQTSPTNMAHYNLTVSEQPSFQMFLHLYPLLGLVILQGTGDL